MSYSVEGPLTRLILTVAYLFSMSVTIRSAPNQKLRACVEGTPQTRSCHEIFRLTVQGLGFRVEGSGLRVQDTRF